MRYTEEANLLTLAAEMSSHTGWSESTLGNKALKRGAFFQELRGGRSTTIRTYYRLLHWFSDNWPIDLEWPEGISRPEQESTHEAAQ